MNLMHERYQKEIAPALFKTFNFKNVMQVPRIQKVVVNIGLGEALDNPKALEAGVSDLTIITGQKPVTTKARQSIANFKLRGEQAIGAKVTLRGARMYEFLERLIKTALPRIRDFRGISPKAFDGQGNYTLGVADQSIFPEVELDKIKRSIGFDITIVTSAANNAEAKALLSEMGVPFTDKAKKPAAKPTAA